MSKRRSLDGLLAGRHFERDVIILCVRWYLRYKLITLDGYAASHRAVREMKADGLLPEDTKVRSSKYLNNVIERDHRNIKSRTNVMLGFKRFRNAATTISGIELMHRILKDPFDLPAFELKHIAAPVVWNAVLFN